MFTIGLLIGLYGYIIFLLGLADVLYAPLIWLVTLGFLLGIYMYFKKYKMKHIYKNTFLKIKDFIFDIKKDTISLLLLLLLMVQVGINFIGVLGPELGFDALWYHVTLPKLYLTTHSISFIPGGLFYYSAMPKFLELLYTGGLAFGSTIFPKFIHFGFGILILFVLYTISRKFFPRRMALLTLVIFYANLVVGWESISAYIDLGRTFFEILSFSALLTWMDKSEKKYFIYSAIFMGFAIMTKLLALGSLIIMLFITFVVLYRKKEKIAQPLFLYTIIALVISLPWFVFSLIQTGNPVYPFFTHTYPVPISVQLINPIYIITSIWNLFLFSADPINPFYLMILPIVFLFFKKWPMKLQLVLLYAIGGFVFWYITPRTGGGRFILPYLPFFSLIAVAALVSISQKGMKQFLFVVALVIACISIGYRGIANAKFLPVIVGKETQSQFLAKHLNFSFGDFYDTDGYFKTHIQSKDTVLLYGFHNEYYVDVSFIDSSFIKKGDTFTYIAVQNGKLPERFHTWSLVYTNPLTHIALYSIGGIPWVY